MPILAISPVPASDWFRKLGLSQSDHDNRIMIGTGSRVNTWSKLAKPDEGIDICRDMLVFSPVVCEHERI